MTLPATELSGLDYIRAIARGDFPQAPMALLLGFDLAEVDEARAVFTAEPGERHYNPMNTVHGGLALTMLDSAMGAAVHTTLAPSQVYGTLETNAHMVRAITADIGRVHAEGRVVHRGSRVATAEASLTAERTGKLLAHGTSTCLIQSAQG
jgi:uncharacterized protein (TIGR00369 family)